MHGCNHPAPSRAEGHMARRDRRPSARYSCSSLRPDRCGDPGRSRTDRLIPAPFVFGNGLLCCSSDEPPVATEVRGLWRTSAHRWEELPCSSGSQDYRAGPWTVAPPVAVCPFARIIGWERIIHNCTVRGKCHCLRACRLHAERFCCC